MGTKQKAMFGLKKFEGRGRGDFFVSVNIAATDKKGAYKIMKEVMDETLHEIEFKEPHGFSTITLTFKEYFDEPEIYEKK